MTAATTCYHVDCNCTDPSPCGCNADGAFSYLMARASYWWVIVGMADGRRRKEAAAIRRCPESQRTFFFLFVFVFAFIFKLVKQPVMTG